MRYLLRRILWLVTVLVIGSLLCFASLTNAPGSALDRPVLPLLFNPAPDDVRTLAQRAVMDVARQGPGSADAVRSLARLGGAALPHVLPRLDELPAEGQVRLAASLAPVGRRMQIGTEEELTSPEQAVIFWSRFWEDRALDFRPAVAKRLARREAERPSPTRREEILGLDTYALPALMGELNGAMEANDVARIARVTRVLSLLTGQNWRAKKESTQEQAQAVARQWHSWWSVHRDQYVALDGPRRVGAMVLQTRYGQWAETAVRTGLDGTDGAGSLGARLASGAAVTLGLLLVALLAGLGGGMAVGLASVMLQRPARGRILLLLILLLASLPAPAVAALTTPTGPLPGTGYLGASIVGGLVAGVAAWYARVLGRSILQEEHYRTLLAGGLPPWRIALLSARQVGVAIGSLLAVHLPEVLSVVLVVEAALGLSGIGSATVRAVQHRDVGWLTLVAVLSTVSVFMAQALGDLLMGRLDPRLSSKLGIASSIRERQP